MDNESRNNERLALAAFVCGIVSIFIFPLAFGSAGIIFGIMAQDRVERDTRAYQYARMGILLGIVGLALWVLALFMANYLSFDMNSFFGGTAPQPSAF